MLVLVATQLAAAPCDDPGWVTTFVDDFDGTELNASNWVARDNITHGDTEKQLYFADDVSVANGALVLTTRRRDAWHDGRHYNFTSGWVESRGLRYQKNGRFEVTAKLPSPAAGHPGDWPTVWPAHWLMPEPSTSDPPNVCWPVGGEIDIMEGFAPTRTGGPDGTSIYLSYHWASECGKDLDAGKFNAHWPPANDTRTAVDWTAWHTYAVEWSADAIVWLVDGVARYSRRVGGPGVPASLFVPKDPMYMILNTALNPWARSNDTGMPVRHVIDRVRWCQRKQQ